MDTALVQRFLSFFQDYINLCQLDSWPDSDTTEVEIKNAFLLSQHIEKCLHKLHKRDVTNEFMAALHSRDGASDHSLKYCLSDPPKYILKKIINSKTNIKQIDVGFQIFLDLFTEEKLENYLADFMLEATSVDTLLKNMHSEISKDEIFIFKSKVLLSELNHCESDIMSLFDGCKQHLVELLVISLLNNEQRFSEAVKLIADAFLAIVISKDKKYKHFWRYLFKVDDKYFLEMCLENADIFTYIVEALSDCGKLAREGICSESFYIDLNESELAGIVKRISTNDSLLCQFLSIVQDYDSDIEFWRNML